MGSRDALVSTHGRGKTLLTFAQFENGEIIEKWGFESLDDWYDWAPGYFGEDWMEDQPGYDLSRNLKATNLSGNWVNVADYQTDWCDEYFWDLQALRFLNFEDDYGSKIQTMQEAGLTIRVGDRHGNMYIPSIGAGVVCWNKHTTTFYSGDRGWHSLPSLAVFAHELEHAYQYITDVFEGGVPIRPSGPQREFLEIYACAAENIVRRAFYSKVPGYSHILPRPSYANREHEDVSWREWGNQIPEWW